LVVTVVLRIINLGLFRPSLPPPASHLPPPAFPSYLPSASVPDFSSNLAKDFEILKVEGSLRVREGRGGGRDLGGKRRKKKNVLVLRQF
jgi:hypothetical protein